MPSTSLAHTRRLIGVLAALVAMSLAAACSSGSAGDKAATGSEDKVAQAASKALERLYGTGTYALPPSTGPTAQRNHRIAVINSGVQTPTGTAQAEAARKVANLLGWKLTVFDGKYEPAAYQEGIRQAIAEHADVIWLFSIDCPLVRTALEEAKRAGIPVVSQEAADCSDVDPSSPSYFARTLQFSEGDFVKWGQGLGAAQATWLLAKLGENADIIEVSVPELVITEEIHEGFAAAMKKQCPKCKVTNLKIRLADLAGLQDKISTALQRNPKANGLAVSYDDLMTGGGAAAVMATGRNDSLQVIAGSGFPANVDLIRKNQGQDAGYGYDATFETWAAADMINRLLAGQGPAPAGVGIAVFDHDHGLPPAGTQFKSNLDYESVFKKVWGVS